MPYVICESCGITTYSAALASLQEECPSCGAHLPLADANVVSLTAHPRFAARARARRHTSDRDPREPA